MLKRPYRRTPVSTCIPVGPLIPGTPLFNLIKPNSYIERPRVCKAFTIQDVENYIKLLKRNYQILGIPFKYPNVTEARSRDINTHKKPEPCLEFVDKIYVKLAILKSGKVKVKIVPNFKMLWDMYYSN